MHRSVFGASIGQSLGQGSLAVAIAAATVGAFASVVPAATVAQWDFNVALGPNNTPAPSIGNGSATPVGMNNNANSADIVLANGSPPSPDPAATDNAWRVRGSVSNGWSGTVSLLSGARFNASTAGYEDVQVSFALHATDGSARHAQFQYTVDGTNFISFGPIIDNFPTFDGFATYSYDLSAIAAADNNPNFGFKVVSAFSPDPFTNANGLQPANSAFQRASAEAQVYTGGAGNYRFDLVTITAVPEPTTLAAIAFAGFVTRRRRNS